MPKENQKPEEAERLYFRSLDGRRISFPRDATFEQMIEAGVIDIQFKPLDEDSNTCEGPGWFTLEAEQ